MFKLMKNFMCNSESGFPHGILVLCQQKGREISETLKRCFADFCCLLEVRWKDNRARSDFKLRVVLHFFGMDGQK